MSSETSLKKSKTGRTARDRRPAAGATDSRDKQDFERSANSAERQEHAEDSDANFTRFLSEWLQEPLPRPPSIPGFHTCWLSTTNQYDPIHKRVRMGYSPVMAIEVPGLENFKVHSGEWAGYVAVNEMLLFKITDALYQRVMKHFHFDMPLQEERAIRERAERLQQEMQDSAGNELVELEDGLKELGRPKKAPIFQ